MDLQGLSSLEKLLCQFVDYEIIWKTSSLPKIHVPHFQHHYSHLFSKNATPYLSKWIQTEHLQNNRVFISKGEILQFQIKIQPVWNKYPEFDKLKQQFARICIPSYLQQQNPNAIEPIQKEEDLLQIWKSIYCQLFIHCHCKWVPSNSVTIETVSKQVLQMSVEKESPHVVQRKHCNGITFQSLKMALEETEENQPFLIFDMEYRIENSYPKATSVTSSSDMQEIEASQSDEEEDLEEEEDEKLQTLPQQQQSSTKSIVQASHWEEQLLPFVLQMEFDIGVPAQQYAQFLIPTSMGLFQSASMSMTQQQQFDEEEQRKGFFLQVASLRKWMILKPLLQIESQCKLLPNMKNLVSISVKNCTPHYCIFIQDVMIHLVSTLKLNDHVQHQKQNIKNRMIIKRGVEEKEFEITKWNHVEYPLQLLPLEQFNFIFTINPILLQQPLGQEESEMFSEEYLHFYESMVHIEYQLEKQTEQTVLSQNNSLLKEEHAMKWIGINSSHSKGLFLEIVAPNTPTTLSYYQLEIQVTNLKSEPVDGVLFFKNTELQEHAFIILDVVSPIGTLQSKERKKCIIRLQVLESGFHQIPDIYCMDKYTKEIYFFPFHFQIYAP